MTTPDMSQRPDAEDFAKLARIYYDRATLQHEAASKPHAEEDDARARYLNLLSGGSSFSPEAAIFLARVAGYK